MAKHIFLKALRHQLDPSGENQQRTPVDVVYCELDGTMVSGRVVCTSSNFKNDTFNFKFIESAAIRTVHAQLLMEVNEMEVML